MFKLSRRSWLLHGLVASGAFLSAWVLPREVWSQDVADLNVQLRSVLRCRRDFEFTFVDRVTDLVNSGDLPYPLVLGLMKYAVRKRPHTPYPWFEQTVRQKANELGVDLGL